MKCWSCTAELITGRTKLILISGWMCEASTLRALMYSIVWVHRGITFCCREWTISWIFSETWEKYHDSWTFLWWAVSVSQPEPMFHTESYLETTNLAGNLIIGMVIQSTWTLGGPTFHNNMIHWYRDSPRTKVKPGAQWYSWSIRAVNSTIFFAN